VVLPAHIAIVMDGNGRWAEARGEARAAGHRAGIEPVRRVIRECARLGVQALTLFAFSSENWRRPETEVAALMGLFMEALDREVEELHANGSRCACSSGSPRPRRSPRRTVDCACRSR
jgi:undecaprenyl diphosphate synthase